MKSIAWSPAYYAQERPDGTLDTNSLEKHLAENIETKAIELISNLDATRGSRMDLTQDQEGHLAFFIGLSLTRVPSFRDGLRDMYSQMAQFTAELVAPELWPGPGPAPKIAAVAKEWVTLEHMIEGAKHVAESILTKEFQFFRASNKTQYITSDNPVVFTGVAPADPRGELFMTLTKRLAVVCTPKRAEHRHQIFDAPSQQVKRMNAAIARAARNRIFASENSDGLDRLAKKYQAFEQKLG